ncbi:MAG: radical SAM protein, partial [Chloroflexi bacterium]|nr:radical SAM protein [Chloroflexota bacterium]
MTITLADYSKIMGEILLKAAHKKQPVSGTFELTERCNMACQMCYVNHSADDLLIRNKELSAGDWLSLASEAIGSGMVFLLLTGGEIFLRQDFFGIYEP